jgi:uncharacterized protein involved in exopolysaccharide biosynthesis
MSLLDALTMIFKHKTKIIIIFLTIVAVVTGVTFLQQPVYEAKSSLLVKIFKDDTSRPGIGQEKGNLPLTLSQDELINTEIQILTGRELAEKVIQTLQTGKMYPSLARNSAKKADIIMDQAVQTFGKNLKILGVRKSNVITVAFQHNDPEIAARAVNLLVDAFKDKHLAMHSDPQSSFIGSQLASFEVKLKASEKNLQEYQQKNKVFSLEEQRSLLLKQRTDFDSAYKITDDNVSEIRKKIASIKSQMKHVENSNVRYTQTSRDTIIVDAQSRLLGLRLKEQELSRKYTDNNRLVVDARKEVETVNQFLKDQEKGIVGKVKTGNPVYQNLEMDLFRAEADLNSQAAKAGALKSQLRELDNGIAALDMSESKIQNLKRELTINEKNYKTYADRHEEARISDAMNTLKLSNISIIQSAVVPVKPIKPKKKQNILLGVLLGIASGLTYAYLLENIAQTFSNPESIEKYLGLPVLITVSSKEVEEYVP